jgi:hypothetical protein
VTLTFSQLELSKEVLEWVTELIHPYCPLQLKLLSCDRISLSIKLTEVRVS